MNWQVIEADVLDWAASYDGPPFMACLCDPPYHLSGGFMSRDWDKGDKQGIAFDPKTWAALAQHLHPGAFVFAFASSRGWHRLAVAIEDAGLVIQPSIFSWATGQSFPKATRIDTQIDKRAGAEQKGTGVFHRRNVKPYDDSKGWNQNSTVGNYEYTTPATDLARAWVGHRYGGQVLKNALEPIICAQVPWTGKRLDCIVETGAGALNVDGGRIETIPRTTHKGINKRTQPGTIYGGGKGLPVCEYPGRSGRWPSNFTLQHDPGCQRVGVRKVKAARGKHSKATPVSDDWKPREGWGRIGMNQGQLPKGYNDPDGTETVADWRCTPTCPIYRLGLRRVDNSVFPQYNKGKQEVNQCCESASIAVVNLMLDHLMSSEDLDGSVAESVAMPASANVERLTHGDSRTSETGAGTDGGESQETASCIASLNTDGFGKCQTGQSQKVMTSTISTEIDRITICPICNSYLQLSIMPCISDGEKTIELNRTGQKQGVVRDAENTNHSRTILNVQRGHTTVTVRIVKENTNESGGRKIPTIIKSTCKDGANVSRFFHQSDWSYEVAERLALADPVRYQAKASRRERDAGLDSLPLRQKEQKRGTLASTGYNPATGERTAPNATMARNPHPCLKPIALTRWLATLLLPPPEYAPRRILIPFAGTGSEAIGALLAGWDEVVMIDNNPEYCELAEARTRWWAGWSKQADTTEPKDILKAGKGQPEPDNEQLELL